MKISVEIEIDKPKDLVWYAITDSENWSNIITGIIDLKVLKKTRKRYCRTKMDRNSEII